jgi:hypothetical protein
MITQSRGEVIGPRRFRALGPHGYRLVDLLQLGETSGEVVQGPTSRQLIRRIYQQNSRLAQMVSSAPEHLRIRLEVLISELDLIIVVTVKLPCRRLRLCRQHLADAVMRMPDEPRRTALGFIDHRLPSRERVLGLSDSLLGQALEDQT